MANEMNTVLEQMQSVLGAALGLQAQTSSFRACAHLMEVAQRANEMHATQSTFDAERAALLRSIRDDALAQVRRLLKSKAD